MRVALLAVVIGGCAPAAVTLGPGHPARRDAPVGRLAGPPAALRQGVGQETAPTPPPQQPGGHEGHGK